MENLIGKKAKVIDGFKIDEQFYGMHQFEEGQIITLLSMTYGKEELLYRFEDEDGFVQTLIESEFEFIEEDGEYYA